MKKVLAILLLSKIAFSTDVPLGTERIKPIEYPKYTLTGYYNSFRYGGITGEEMGRLNPTYGLKLSFDVGLYRYLNAGAGLSITGTMDSDNPAHYRLSFFMRPKVAFFEDRLAIFTRIGGGPTVMFNNSPIENLKKSLPPSAAQVVAQKYNCPYYSDINPGVHGLATIGIEYFPISRLGLTLEWGILADYLHVSKSESLKRKIEKERGPINDTAPYSFGYLDLEAPITLSLNLIF